MLRALGLRIPSKLELLVLQNAVCLCAGSSWLRQDGGRPLPQGWGREVVRPLPRPPARVWGSLEAPEAADVGSAGFPTGAPALAQTSWGHQVPEEDQLRAPPSSELTGTTAQAWHPPDVTDLGSGASGRPLVLPQTNSSLGQRAPLQEDEKDDKTSATPLGLGTSGIAQPFWRVEDIQDIGKLGLEGPVAFLQIEEMGRLGATPPGHNSSVAATSPAPLTMVHFRSVGKDRASWDEQKDAALPQGWGQEMVRLGGNATPSGNESRVLMLPVSLLQPLASAANATLARDVNHSRGEVVQLHGVTYRLEDVLRLLQDSPLEVEPHRAASPVIGLGRRVQRAVPLVSPSESLAELPVLVAASAPPTVLPEPDPGPALKLERSEGDAPLMVEPTYTSEDHRLLRGIQTESVARGSEPSSFALAAFVCMLGGIVLLCMLALSFRSDDKDGSEVRKWVEGLPVLTAADIEVAFQPRGGYDCALMPAQELEGAVRIEGRVVAPPTSTLRAPITRRSCVLFSASAGEKRLDGVGAPPLAYHAINADFEIVPIRPAGADLRIHVRGQDVALFDMATGRHLETHALGEAPEHLQDFARAHRVVAQSASDTMGRRGVAFARSEKSSVVEFRESLLEEGAVVTCVGELRRSATGEIGLWPLSSSTSPAIVGVAPSPGGLTSWEATGCSETQVEKVVISDDPRLLSTRGTPLSLTFGSGRSRQM